MSLTLGKQAVRHCKVYPILWLFWERVLIWHSDFVVCEDFIEILLSAFRIIICESKFLNFTLVVIKENSGIKSLICLFPHFHDKEVSIESILSLLVGIG